VSNWARSLCCRKVYQWRVIRISKRPHTICDSEDTRVSKLSVSHQCISIRTCPPSDIRSTSPTERLCCSGCLLIFPSYQCHNDNSISNRRTQLTAALGAVATSIKHTSATSKRSHLGWPSESRCVILWHETEAESWVIKYDEASDESH
jgi:hypothetical protein